MYKVFISDDEPWVLMAIKSMIDWNSYGFMIVGEANEGKGALERILNIKPDLVISDIRMPGMTGLDLIEAIKEQDLICETVLISGFSDFEYARRAIQLGVKGYLVKPVKEEELISILIQVRESLTLRNNRIKILESEFHEIGYLSEKTKVGQIINYINLNYSQQISLQSISEEFHMSESHISNLIKKRSGKKFSEHLTLARITKAQELLSSSNLSIEDIAEEVGYVDAFYFSRVYKKATGLSPSEFRRQI